MISGTKRPLQCLLCEDNFGTALIPSAATPFRGCAKAAGPTWPTPRHLRTAGSSTEAKEAKPEAASERRPVAKASRFPPAIKTLKKSRDLYTLLL